MNTAGKKGLTALVTGGSRGIGRAVSVRLAAQCAETVVVNYLENDIEAERTKKLIEEQGSVCVLVKANLFHVAEVDKLFSTVQQGVGRLDVFVHCAAVTAFKPLKDIRPNQWDLTMNVNARSFLLCAQKCIPLMKEGKIVAISSLGSSRAIANYGALGPTKAALESTVRYLAVELAPSGIQVNAVSGGFVPTDSFRHLASAEKLAEAMLARTPSKRLGTPDDIAGVVLFLLSPSASWICGQTIVVDGGLSLV
jgi:enoyl-[acyl-carrier protein] reductase III